MSTDFPSLSPLPKIVVFISGNGSNLQAMIDACVNGTLAAKMVGVISNRADAYGIQRAQHAQIPVHIHARMPGQTRAEYDRQLAARVQAWTPDWIVLAGWMHILSHDFLQHFPHQVINLHPALPGQFPGLHAIERAFTAYQSGEIQETGVMVHQVPDEAVDAGPVLAYARIPVYPHDNLTTLTQRVQQTEHRLLIETLQKLMHR